MDPVSILTGLSSLTGGGGLSAPTNLTSGANPVNTVSFGSLVFGGGAGSSTSANQSLPTPGNILNPTGAGTSEQSVFAVVAVIAFVGFYLWKKGKFK